MPEIATEENLRQIRIAKRLIRRKRWLYDVQNHPFSDLETDDALAEYLDNATFINKDGEVCEFTQLQKHDLNLVLQKRYALLNWLQGSGKTAAVYHRAKHLLKYGKVRNVVILAPCHCPGKATVFGIEKQNQDVYNKEELFDLIGKTIITRKFRDFAGEKYKIRTHTVRPSEGEHEVYRVIIEEFCRICELYYNSTGDTKKDAGLIEMELKSDVRIRLDKARKDGYGFRLRLDNERSEYDCSIKHVYGVCYSFFGKQVSIVPAN